MTQDRSFNDPIVDCCGRDAADCDCPPKYATIALGLGTTVQAVAQIDKARHSAVSLLARYGQLGLDIEEALKDYDKEHSHDGTDD